MGGHQVSFRKRDVDVARNWLSRDQSQIAKTSSLQHFIVQSDPLSAELRRQRVALSATLRRAAEAQSVAQRAGPEAGGGLGRGGA